MHVAPTKSSLVDIVFTRDVDVDILHLYNQGSGRPTMSTPTNGRAKTGTYKRRHKERAKRLDKNAARTATHCRMIRFTHVAR